MIGRQDHRAGFRHVVPARGPDLDEIELGDHPQQADDNPIKTHRNIVAESPPGTRPRRRRCVIMVTNTIRC